MLTFHVDVFLTGVPYPRVEISKQKPVISGLPAVHNFSGVGLVHAVVVDAVVLPLLRATRFRNPLRTYTPVRGQ